MSRWELFTYGKIPFFELDNKSVVLEVVKGTRPKKPENCPDEVFEIMTKCWNASPEARPSFQALVEMLTKLKQQDPEVVRQVEDIENYYSVTQTMYN